MPVPYGQAKLAKGYKPTYDPISSKADEYVTAMQGDGGKSAISAVLDGAQLSLHESFEALGMNKLAMEYEAERQGKDVTLVTVEEAEEKWGLTLDEPRPLHEVLFLNEINQDSAQHMENVLRDLSMRHGPVNFMGSLAGVLGMAALLPSNWLGLGIYKHTKNIPRYIKLLTLAKKSREAKRAKNLAKVAEAQAAEKALRAVAAKPVPILEGAAVVGAENVLYAHLKENEGIKTDKALAFGIGAGAGIFLPVVAKALTRSGKAVKEIPANTAKKAFTLEVLEQTPVKKAPIEEGPIAKENLERFNQVIKEAQDELKTAKVEQPKITVDKLEEPEMPKAEPGKPAKALEPGKATQMATAKRVNAMIEKWGKIDPVEKEASLDMTPLAAVEEAPRLIKEPKMTKVVEDMTPEQKSVSDSVVDDGPTLEDYIAMNEMDTPTRVPSAEDKAFQKAIRAEADATNNVDTLVAKLEEIPGVKITTIPDNSNRAMVRALETGEPSTTAKAETPDSTVPGDEQLTGAVKTEDATEAVAVKQAVTDSQMKEPAAFEEAVPTLDDVAPRAEPELIQGNLFKTAAPAHVVWGNALFGDIWEETLVNAMVAFRQMGIRANVTDIYPQFKHPSAFKGWVEQQARWLKRTKGVYTTRQLMDKVLEKREDQIEYYLEKYAKPNIKDLGDNKMMDGTQAKPKTAVGEESVQTLQTKEETVPVINEEEFSNALKAAKPKGRTLFSYQSKKTRGLEVDLVELPDGKFAQVQRVDASRIVSPKPGSRHEAIHQAAFDARKKAYIKEFKDADKALAHYNKTVGGQPLTRSDVGLPAKPTKIKVGESRKVKLATKVKPKGVETKEVTLVDKDAVRPTVDNNAGAKLALEQRYPDIQFQPSKSAVVEGGPQGEAVATVGKNDIFNLKWKGERGDAAKSIDRGIEVELLQPAPGIFIMRTTDALDAHSNLARIQDYRHRDLKRKMDAVIAAKDEEAYRARGGLGTKFMEDFDKAQKQGKALVEKEYQTLKRALKAFKEKVQEHDPSAKVPEVDEIKMGPERGAAKMQQTAEEAVSHIKKWVDCRNGKSVQSDLQQGGDAAAGAVGRGTTGAG